MENVARGMINLKTHLKQITTTSNTCYQYDKTGAVLSEIKSLKNKKVLTLCQKDIIVAPPRSNP